MIFRPVANEGSGCIAYLVGCEHERVAAVVDPGRPDLEQWLALARAKDLAITGPHHCEEPGGPHAAPSRARPHRAA